MKKELALALTSLSLLGCGGGGSPSSAPPPTSPDTFLTTLSPNIGETNVEPDTTIKATFSEDLLASSVDDESLKLQIGSVELATTYELDQTGKGIQVTPQEDMFLLTKYTAVLAGSISDQDGSSLGGNLNWDFTTRDGIWRESEILESNNNVSATFIAPPQLRSDGNAFSYWLSIDNSSQGSLNFKSLVNDQWEPTFQINSNGTDVLVPQLVSNSRGDILAVWIEESGDNTTINSRYYNSQTEQWSDIEQLPDSNTSVHWSYSLGLSQDGIGYAAWSQQKSQNDFDIFVSRFQPNAGWQPVEVTETSTQDNDVFPRITVDLNNNVFLSWINVDDSNPIEIDIHTRQYLSNGNGGGTWQPSTEFGINQSNLLTHYQLSNGLGNTLIIWSEENQSEGVTNLYARYHDSSDTNPWGPINLIEDKDTDLARIFFSMDGVGNALITWQQETGSDNNLATNVYSNYYSVAEATWLDEPTFVAQLSTAHESEQANSSLSSSITGNAILTWSTEEDVEGEPNITENVLRSRVFLSSTQTWQPTQVIETENYVQGSAQTVMDLQSHGLTSWIERGDEDNILISRYNSSSNEWNTPTQLTEDLPLIRSRSINVNIKGEALLLWDQRDDSESEIISKRFN